jgi:ribosomal protein L11 methyltransferase
MKQKNYISLTININEEDLEIGYAILNDFPFIGMEEMLDRVVLYFEEKDWNDEIKTELNSLLEINFPYSKISDIKIIPDKNWNEEWEKNVQPVYISHNIIITPEWKMADFDCKYKIIINPKMSFGTGQHSTTRLMATMIEEFFIENGIKDIWIDAGTGTGVLSIITAKLGAKKIYAFDNDEWAYENAVENVKLNSVQDKVEVLHTGIDEYNFPKSDCICANMFLGLIVCSFSKFYTSLKENNGILFVSGILLFDRDNLLKSANENGFILLKEKQELEWCCFKFGIQ